MTASQTGLHSNTVAHVLENLHVMVLLVESNGIILYSNCEIQGLLPEQLIGTNFHDYWSPISRELSIQKFQQACQNKTVESYNTTYMNADGYVNYYRIQINPIIGELDDVNTLAILGTPITERGTEGYPPKKNTQDLPAIYDIGHELMAVLDTTEIFKILYRKVAQKLFSSSHFSIALYNNETRTFTHKFAIINGKEINSTQTSLDEDEELLKSIINSKQPKAINLEKTGSTLSDENLSVSALYVPLIKDSILIGVMSFRSPRLDAFRNVNLESILTIATQAATAITNAQLYEEVSNNATELATLYQAMSILFVSVNLDEMSNRIVQFIGKNFPEIDCCLMLIDKEQGLLVPHAYTHNYTHQKPLFLELEKPSLLTQVINTGKAIHIQAITAESGYIGHESCVCSALIVPLDTNDRVIGILDLQSSQINTFDSGRQGILITLGEQLALVIDNSRLYEQVRTYTIELEQRVIERTEELRVATKRAESMLRRVEAILNSSSDAIIYLNVYGEIQQTNPSFDNLLGYERDEAFGKSISILVAPDQSDALNKALQAVIEDHLPQRIELNVYRSDKSSFIADIALAVIQAGADAISGIVCSIRDITSHKKLEERLRHTIEQERELSELKTRFISMTSHEFRTPLASILSSSELLQNYHHKMDAEELNKSHKNIQEKVIHMEQLLDDVLTMGRMEEEQVKFEPKTIDIQSFCQKIVADYRQNYNKNLVGIEFLPQEDCGDIFADPKLLHQIIGNLLSNAIKYSIQNSKVFFRLTCSETVITLQIEDHGIGIPEEELDHLFQPFHRAVNVGTISGTGLGLAITKRAVELHKGTIAIKSEVGKGTTCIITLPRSASTNQSIDTKERNPENGKVTGH